MGATPIHDKCISISNSGITLGRKVASFFKNQGTLFVNIILNYKDNTLIIIDTGIRGESKLNYTEQGMRVMYETNYKRNTNIKLTRITSFLNMDGINIFRARPFKKNSIIVENISLNESFSIRNYMMQLDMKNKLVMFGNLKELSKIKLEDVSLQMPEDKMVVEKSTTTTNKASDLNISVKPIQKFSTSHIPDKRNAPLDPPEMPAENYTPTEEQIIIDKEYSKMILGE